jgi:hypothetical protein
MLKTLICFLFAGALLSASPVNVKYVSHDGVNDGSYYVGPYSLSINNGPNIAGVCIDPFHDAYPGDHWSANLTPLSAAASAVPGLSNTYLGNAGLKQYEEQAYLFSLITTPGVTHDHRISIQHAIWNIMDPGFVSDASDQKYLDLASANFESINPNYFTIVSDVNDDYQEFMISSAPEPATFALMGLAAIGLGLTRLRKRNQIS